MHSENISRITELSVLGLLADQVLFALEMNQEAIPVEERYVFASATALLSQAVEGLDSAANLRVRANTPLAVGTYQVVASACGARLRARQPREEIRERLESMRAACDRIANTGDPSTNTQMLTEFFSAISDYTSAEQTILTRAVDGLVERLAEYARGAAG